MGCTRCWRGRGVENRFLGGRELTHLVVVDVPLPVNSLSSLNALLGAEGLLNDLGCDFRADLHMGLAAERWMPKDEPRSSQPGENP